MRGKSGLRTIVAMKVSNRQFETLVEEALEDLPAEFKDLLVNIAIVIEEEPSDDDLDLLEDEEESDDDELLGIYRGVPRTERSYNEIPGLPDQIAIFRGPILRVCDTADDVVREVSETVIHELGHYFGLEDDDMPF